MGRPILSAAADMGHLIFSRGPSDETMVDLSGLLADRERWARRQRHRTAWVSAVLAVMVVGLSVWTVWNVRQGLALQRHAGVIVAEIEEERARAACWRGAALIAAIRPVSMDRLEQGVPSCVKRELDRQRQR